MKKSSTRSVVAVALALMVLPVLTVLVVLWLDVARGPFWLGRNLDPAYAHLFNGLNIALFVPPVQWDQPGTPVQIAAGAVIRLTHLLAGREALPLDVLKRPETYLDAIHYSFLAFYALTLLAAGAVVLYATGSVTLALVVQATPFLSTNGVEALTRVSPEAVLMSLSLIFAVILLIHVEKPEDEERLAKTAGVMAGLLLATKLTALPIAVVPYVLFVRPLKRRLLAIYAGASAAAFVVATLPIARDYGHLLSWAIRVLTHRGLYGQGPVGLEDPARFWTFLVSSLRSELPSVILVSCGCLLLWRAALPDSPLQRRRRRILFALISAMIFQFLISAKQPMPRYLVPALGTLGVIVALVVLVIRDARGKLPDLRPVVVVVGLTLAFLDVRSLISLRDWHLAERIAQEQIVDQAKQRHEGWPALYSYSASALPYALRFGNVYVYNRYSAELAKLYPAVFVWDPFAKGFSTFSGPLTISEMAQRGKFLYQGPPLEGYLGFRLDPPPNATFRPLFATPVEALYEASFANPPAIRAMTGPDRSIRSQ